MGISSTILLVIFATILFSIFLIVKAFKYYSEIEKRGVKAQAIILSVKTRMKFTNTPQFYYKVKYIGSDGDMIESTMHFQKELEIGSFVYIKYLPEKPKMVNYSYVDNVKYDADY